MMTARARISGTGMYVPDQVVTNADLEELMDTSDEWIRQRSGIAERRYVVPGETPVTLAERAARAALEDAGLKPRDLDCIVLATLEEAGVKQEDVDLFLFHQANLRINEYVAGQLDISPERTFCHIERYGNCSAASIPMLLAECTREGRLVPGNLVCMTGFGSGFSWGSAVARW